MKIKYFVSTAILTLLLSANVYAGTVISAPIDSRPISTDYLNNLVELGGDEYIPLNEDNMDFFSVYDNLNHFGNSKNTRADLYDKVSQHNNEDTTVIINTSSYITGGLVGSRCGINYMDYKDAISDLKRLITDNDKPTYYINISMPRSLPETRFNKIWRENQTSFKGIAYYYLKHNPNCEDKDTILKTYATLNQTQLLMEYGYTQNKLEELGEDSLMPWEKDFLDNFNHKYLKKEPYKSYIYKYKLTYTATADILRQALNLQQAGLLDEIIISNDDLQLPNSITYFYNKGYDWVPVENNSAIKFSFARKYMKTGPGSIYAQVKAKYGEDFQASALLGKTDKLNYIFGTDEIPQLIYARDLAKRKQLTANFNDVISSSSGTVGAYDVVGINELMLSNINFVGANITNKTNSQFDIYLYDYTGTTKKRMTSFIRDMNNSYTLGNDVGLIEIFSPEVSASGANDIFKELVASKNDLTITNLASYSAWNTNANAIGLGVAHSQVYAIAKQGTTNAEGFLSSQIKVLAQHILEDGIFTPQTKRALANEGFKPAVADMEYSEKLYSLLNADDILNLFLSTDYVLNDETYSVKKCTLDTVTFPWCRNFECYLDINAEVE